MSVLVVHVDVSCGACTPIQSCFTLYRSVTEIDILDSVCFPTPQATVEPVIYAALSTSQPRKKGTATVDHHQVTYATVDSDATKKQEAKAAILPAIPTGEYVCVIFKIHCSIIGHAHSGIIICYLLVCVSLCVSVCLCRLLVIIAAQ